MGSEVTLGLAFSALEKDRLTTDVARLIFTLLTLKVCSFDSKMDHCYVFSVFYSDDFASYVFHHSLSTI